MPKYTLNNFWYFISNFIRMKDSLLSNKCDNLKKIHANSSTSEPWMYKYYMTSCYP